MPRKSIIDLRKAVEAAPEMTAEHRARMLELVDSLDKEVGEAEGDGADRLRGAIAAAEEAVRGRSDGGESDPRARISELEERVERIALEHPVVANVLAAISRLV